jgi:thioredoxin reductase (NADPH)
MTFFSTAERLEIGGLPFVCTQPKPGRAEALEYYRRVAAHFGLQLGLFEAVTAVVKQAGHFEVTTAKATYRAGRVVVATGFYDKPVTLGVPGEALPKVTHYYNDPHFYAFQRVLVVGGNNSAVDAALECWRKGAVVTMVMQQPDIGERVKYWVRPDVVNRIKEGSIAAYTQSTVKAIYPDRVVVQTPGAEVVVPNDWVLAMTGYQPDFAFLRQMGVQLQANGRQQPVYNPHTMETNVAGLYLAGVVVGGMDTHLWFIENSREHAEKIARHMASVAKPVIC